MPAQSVQSVVNFEDIKAGLKAAVIDAVSGLVEGAQADIAEFGNAIVQDIATALALPSSDERDRVLKELWGQVQLLGEVNRLRAVNAAWNAVAATIRNVVAGALAILGASLDRVKLA